MYEFAVGFLKTIVSAVTGWFTTVFEATGVTSLYIAAICIVFAIGFVAARFGPAISMGSDMYQEDIERRQSEQRAIKAASDKAYRESYDYYKRNRSRNEEYARRYKRGE